ncbi:hypothetical protein V6N13_127109 [Hibiscus sabdariffa]
MPWSKQRNEGGFHDIYHYNTAGVKGPHDVYYFDSVRLSLKHGWREAPPLSASWFLSVVCSFNVKVDFDATPFI